MNDISQGFELMLYGLSGVFSVLILLYILIVVLVKAFPYKSEDK